MIWRDLFLSKNISDYELTNAFSLVFNINANKVNLIHNDLDCKDDFLLRCRFYSLPGKFCFQLDCYTTFEIEDEYESISRLCKIWDCQALITNDEEDGEDNAYAFILFEPSGQSKKVEVDPEVLDQHNDIKIIHERPFPRDIKQEMINPLNELDGKNEEIKVIHEMPFHGDIKQEMINLLNEIFDEETFSRKYGRDYFNGFLPKLKKYDFAEILAYLTKFILRDVLGFILFTPLLWTDLSDIDWIEIMFLLNPRPQPCSTKIFNTGYIDIHFLCKYIRVNAIETFLQQKEFSDEDKKKLLQYSKQVVHFLFIDQLDEKSLDGNYYVHKDELEKIRLNLVATGKFKPLNYTEDEFRQYIEEELKNYS